MMAITTDRRQGVNSSAAVKVPCRCATTAAITLSGLQTVDGVALAEDDRVLVKDQSDATTNGIYNASSGTWQRSLDFDGFLDVVTGTLVIVNSGTANSNTMWRVTTTGIIIPGTSNIAFDRIVIDTISSLDFLQSGTGAVTRNAQDKMREIFSVKDFGAIGDGVTDDTVAIAAAIAAANTGEKLLYVNEGTFLTDKFVVPTTLKGITGAGKYHSTFKFIRQSYSAGAILMDCSDNSVGIRLENFTIDCDSTEFKTAGIYALVLNNSDNVQVSSVRVVGRGASGFFTDEMTHGRIRDVTIDATGTATNTFDTCLYGTNCIDVVVDGLRTTGVPDYGASLAAGSVDSHIINSHCDGTDGAFAFSLAGAVNCSIENCTVVDSSHEAYSLADCLRCSINNCKARWGSAGTDYGCSIGGTVAGGGGKYNIIEGCTFENSYKAGIVFTDHCSRNKAIGNLLLNCADRGTDAAGGGGAEIIFGCVNELTGVTNSSNEFEANSALVEGDTVTYGYGEINAGGSTLNSHVVRGNSIVGVGTRYLLVSATTNIIEDDTFISYTPTISPGSGAITSYTVNSAAYKFCGRMLEIKFDITITNNGTGATNITVTFPSGLDAGTNSGAINGIEIGVTGKSFSGSANSNGATLVLYDSSYPGQTNARLVGVGRYERA